MESLFEYGSRAGLWRLIRLFDSENIPLTFFVTGLALSLNPTFSTYLRSANHEIAGHGWRWIDYESLSMKEEKNHIKRCVETIKELTGKQVEGWYTGRHSRCTRELLIDLGGFLYDSDSYADDYPYFLGNHLIIPYSLDCNDFRFGTSAGFANGDDFFHHLKNSFDYLYQENRQTLMSIGLHPRFSGHPGRCMAVKQFIDYIKQFSDIWISRRIDIARHWLKEII
nr:polysaccharide deacetylase family protein [Legionella sp.]